MRSLHSLLAAVVFVMLVFVAGVTYIHYQGTETVLTQAGGHKFSGHWVDQATGDELNIEVSASCLLVHSKGRRLVYRIDKGGLILVEDGTGDSYRQLTFDNRGRLEWSQTNAAAGSRKVQYFERKRAD